jgi:hypothetical protein
VSDTWTSVVFTVLPFCFMHWLEICQSFGTVHFTSLSGVLFYRLSRNLLSYSSLWFPTIYRPISAVFQTENWCYLDRNVNIFQAGAEPCRRLRKLVVPPIAHYWSAGSDDVQIPTTPRWEETRAPLRKEKNLMGTHYNY